MEDLIKSSTEEKENDNDKETRNLTVKKFDVFRLAQNLKQYGGVWPSHGTKLQSDLLNNVSKALMSLKAKNNFRSQFLSVKLKKEKLCTFNFSTLKN